MVLFVDRAKEPELYDEYERRNSEMSREFLIRNIELSFKGLRKGHFGLEGPFIRSLNHFAMVNLVEHPGAFRFEDVHLPRFKNYRALPPQEVPDAFRALVARWHQEWGKRDPIGLATDVLWQLIKLQPFVDGNKRIARMAAYFVLNRCFGQVLQGSNTMLVQIERDPSEFYDALWFAFETDSLGQANTGKLEDMVGRYVKRQLESAAPRER